MAYNAPPDNLILEAIEWLRNEIYPGLLGEQFDDRACAVWICGSRGYISLWNSIGMDDQPQQKHQAIKEIIYDRIDKIKNPPPPTAGGISGFLTVDRLGYRDDSGPQLPLFCHFGEAFSAYCRRPGDVLDELGRIKAAGYDGIRFWDVLGYWDAAWKGREVSPFPFTSHSGVGVRATADYYVRLASFLRELRALGLKAHHTRGDLNSWTNPMIESHLREVAKVQRQVGLDTIALNEVCNESWQNGIPAPSELHRLAYLLPQETIRATSAADDGYGGETPDAFEAFARDVQIIHGYRSGESHNRIAHVMAVGYETCPRFRKPAWQGEPIGGGVGVSVNIDNNVESLCLLAAMSLSTHQAWCFMSGNGVFWNGSIAEMPAFMEVPRVRSIISKDIMNDWDIFHGGERWRDRRILEASADGSLRCDHMVKGQEFQIIAYGTPGAHNIPVARSFEGEIIRPASLERIPVRMRAGELLATSFERGIIIQGKVI